MHFVPAVEEERRSFAVYKVWSTSSETDFLLGHWYTSGHPCLQGGVLELPLSLGKRWSQRASQSFARFGRRDSCTCALLLFARAGVRWKLYGANHHGRWDVGLRVWPGDETSVFAVEVCWFPEAKESAPGAVKSQSHAHCFLWYGRHCSL